MAASLSSDSDPFTIIDPSSSLEEDSFGLSAVYPHQISTDYKSFFSAKAADLDVQLTTALRRQYPSHTLTIILENNCPLLTFAANGHATASLDDKNEDFMSYRLFLRGGVRGQPGQLADSSRFAKYNYLWEDGEFIIYRVQVGFTTLQYVLCQPVGREKPESRSIIVDGLIRAVGEWVNSVEGYVFVFDGFWSRSRALYEEVQKARWDDVILDEELKTSLTELVGRFFDSKDVYDDLGVPWKRGIILYGPPGNGKTISIKALMHTLSARKDPIPSLYVKSARSTYAIRNIFTMARQMTPCLLIFEDIDTIVNINTRAYFFNEVDGLENNDGIMMVASTNYLERLDPGLTKRPSRFDQKYLFPLPTLSERTQYCSYWRHKLNSRSTNTIDFPTKLCPALALLMDGFSFAYMKEAFVTSLLVIAGERQGKELRRQINDGNDNGDDLDSYQIFREMKKQIKVLREDMGKSNSLSSFTADSPPLLETQMDRNSKRATSASSIDDDWNPIFNITSKVGSFPAQYEIEVKGSTKVTSKDISSSEATTHGTFDEASGSNAHPINAVSISSTSGDKDWKSNFKITAQIGNFPFIHDLEVECNSRRVDSKPGSTITHDTMDIPFPEPLPPVVDSPITAHRTLHGMGMEPFPFPFPSPSPSPSPSNMTFTEIHPQPHRPGEKIDTNSPIPSTSSPPSFHTTQVHVPIQDQDPLVNNTTFPIPGPLFACPIPYR